MKRLLPVGAAALVLAALVVVYAFWWSSGPKHGPHDVIIAEGSTIRSVSRQLAKEGAIPGSARTYYLMARLLGSSDPSRPASSRFRRAKAAPESSTCFSTASRCFG